MLLTVTAGVAELWGSTVFSTWPLVEYGNVAEHETTSREATRTEANLRLGAITWASKGLGAPEEGPPSSNRSFFR